MRNSDHFELRVRSYFLGLGSTEELDETEEICFSSSDYADLISDVEARLISDYAQDRLTALEKRAFEGNYLVIPERLEQVAIARAAGKRPIVAQAPRLGIAFWRFRMGWRRRVSEWVGAHTPLLFATAGVAIAVMAALNISLFFRWREQTAQLEFADSEVRELRRTLTPKVGTGDIEFLKRLSGKTTPLHEVRILSTPILRFEETTLSAGMRKSVMFRLPGSIPDRLELPLEVPSVDEGSLIDVRLTVAGKAIWSADGIVTTKSNGIAVSGSSVSIEDKLGVGASVVVRDVGDFLKLDLRLPTNAIREHFGQPLDLDIMERGHAQLASFRIVFNREVSRQ